MPKRSLSDTSQEAHSPTPDHTTKYTHLSPSTSPLLLPHSSLIQDPHPHTCLSCSSTLQTPHYLTLHISELHDPFTAVRRARGEKTYACLVEGCDRVCGDWRKRRQHCVDKHGFPREFDFWGVVRGKKEGVGGLSLLRDGEGHEKGRGGRKERGEMDGKDGDVEGEEGDGRNDGEGDFDGGENEHRTLALLDKVSSQDKDVAMNDISDAMAALKFVPKSVSFGRRKGGAGLAKS